MPINPRTLLLLLALATLLIQIPVTTAQDKDEEIENIPAILSGVRTNAVEGNVLYVRESASFDLEPTFELKQGDAVRSAAGARAELLLQPGNFLRLAAESEFQLVDDRYDRLKLLLNKGTISFELLKNDWEDTSDFFETLKQGFELIRVITPNAEVFITQPGIFRINTTANGRTEIIVRRGEALIDGRRVKEKRSAVAARGSVEIIEIDSKSEDAFDAWGRERSEQVVDANRKLKKEAPWAKKKDGREAMVDLPANETKAGNPYVVSARPGAVNFVETGVEFSVDQKNWQPLTDTSQLAAGNRVRTPRQSFLELTMFPDLYLRVDGDSEVSLEQLSNELIAVKVLHGSAILDVARFERKEFPEIFFGGATTMAAIAEDGNYRVNMRGREEIMVRKGKVVLQERSIGSCRIIAAGNTSECDRKINDNFDVWSQHRGEGQFYNGTAMATRLAQLRRRRFKNTGFWYQLPARLQFTFVPFFSTYFRSPYGGTYSCVLSPRPGMIRTLPHPMGPLRGPRSVTVPVVRPIP
jgi:hypothetical protein